jgi:hypothetical protein
MYIRLHSHLIPYHIGFSQNLLIENGLKINHCQSPRLNTHDLTLSISNLSKILIEQSRHLSGFPTSCISSDQNKLVFDYCVQNFMSFIVNRQLKYLTPDSTIKHQGRATIINMPSYLFRHIDAIHIIALFSRRARSISSVPSSSFSWLGTLRGVTIFGWGFSSFLLLFYLRI